MNLCSDGHDEVCYEGRNCPACEALEDLRIELQDKIGELEGQIREG